ncbi:MAG: hypothetical protein MI975_08125 [Cytophagales bacterium]|nr:hypothetical protein [Cytophagales bacterium]
MRLLFSLILVILITSSCNQPGCYSNSNEILNDKDKNSWAYQHELMRLIEENPSDVTYYFERRAEINGESFIVMNCYGPDFCGELKTKFVHKNLESIKLQNQGWKGAKLIGVEFKRVKLDSGHEVFAFEKLTRISD